MQSLYKITEEMKKLVFKVLAGVAVVVMAAACTGGSEKSSGSTDAGSLAADTVDIRGQWSVENIVFSDSVNVRPEEAAPGAGQYIVFDGSKYFVQTNCNTMSGEYALYGDSIAIGDGAMTEMACDNMETEQALRSMLPNIRSVTIECDTIMRLKGRAPSEYILLRKSHS